MTKELLLTCLPLFTPAWKVRTLFRPRPPLLSLLATDLGTEHNGVYLQDAHIADPWTETVKPWGTSPIEAERLWKLSEKLVGEVFLC